MSNIATCSNGSGLGSPVRCQQVLASCEIWYQSQTPAFVVCRRQQSCLARGSIAAAKSASHEKRASGVHPGAASENSGARVSTDRRKAYAKRESVLVVTVGILDATAR